MLLLSTVFSSYAQEKNDGLPYPDLIPILENGLYGYCDKDKNIIIEPQFEGAAFFGEDLDFLDIKVPKKKIFGSSAYATVWQDGQRMRIDKKGNVVYQYNPDDFNEIRPKESINASIKQSYEKFQDDQTRLWGGARYSYKRGVDSCTIQYS
ncbi:WG containing repeat-containing protein [Paenimyroides aquimaris]|uniref:WG containing repeat-containing protein n=2 Tax=Paenimyroides marinum TaxID=1159016 RepID=A0A1H6M3G0_9FLAO|nr:WG containing repeat-containing protein [Paenimyroides aquimaris]